MNTRRFPCCDFTDGYFVGVVASDNPEQRHEQPVVIARCQHRHPSTEKAMKCGARMLSGIEAKS